MPPAQERQRTTKACVACSIRKIKCDGQDPCAHCQRFFNSECFYTTAKKRGPPKGSPARGGHRKKIATDANGLTPSSSASGSTGVKMEAGSSQQPMDGRHPPIQPLQHQHRGSIGGMPSAPATVGPASSTPGHSVVSEGGSTEQQDLLATFDMHMAQLDMFAARQQAQEHTFSRSPHASMSSPSQQTSVAPLAGLTSAAIDDLLLVFETFIHPHWPIIYLPALRSLRSLETSCPLLFDAVLAISAANSPSAFHQDNLLPTEKTSTRPLVVICEVLTESVRNRVLSTFKQREHAPSLQQVQALICVSLVDFGGGRTSLAYQMSGIASRMSLDLGLHTDFGSSSFPALDIRDTQERVRTLWACFILDKMVAVVNQRPVSLRFVDIDAPRPSVMERDELDLWLAGPAQSLLHPQVRQTMECVKSHALSSFSSWCDVMAILELILDQVYRPSTRRARMEGLQIQGYEEAVVHIDNELRKWRENLPPHLQWSDDDENAHVMVGQHILTVRGWYYICVLLLHRPQVPYLDTADSPDTPLAPAAEDRERYHRPVPVSYRLPNGADATRRAATAVCTLMESYERTFRVRKFASSWVYLCFQAATVHAGLAAHGLDGAPTPLSHLSPQRAESLRRLEECIQWLDQMAMQWSSAGRHVEILRKLSAVGARTRPPSPGIGDGGQDGYLVLQDPGQQAFIPQQTGQEAMPGISPLELNAWMLLWASMPTAGDDIDLWQQCFPTSSLDEQNTM